MPVITLPYNDLENLTSADRSVITDRIPMIGADIERLENDHIDIEFFPDRPDLYSVEGVSRALRGFLEIETGMCEYDVSTSGFEISVDTKLDGIRPWLACAVIRGIKFDSNSIKSLMDLQEDLHWGLGRNRKKISIGVHDLKDIQPPFRYIAVDPDFEFVPLDFSEPMSLQEILQKHPKGIRFANILEEHSMYPLIVDVNDNVLSFPPIINGNLTRVTEDTTDLFIDVTGLSDSVDTALNIVVTALAERGGKIESVKIISPEATSRVTPQLDPIIRKLKKEDIESIIGIRMSMDEIIHNLEKMRYGTEVVDNETVLVKVPPYRADILHNYDIIEDIAIGYGYENIQPIFPECSTVGCEHTLSVIGDRLREIMIGLEYFQVMPFTLTNDKIHFEWMCRDKTDDVTYVLHPISEDQTMLRTTILPNLLEILSLNQHRELPQRIFEVGEVVRNEENRMHIAAVSIHPNANFTEVQEIVDAVMREQVLDYNLSESVDPAFMDGRRADIFVDGKKIGVMGEFYPQLISNFGLGQPIAGFEMQILPEK
ncbi:phenylalanyl-tRNA synthetase, beta subunit [Methanosalsum zhilinae DSM 4017]|uniref:Phenylalanine--tRNA ligase beta subunit n=1 Tax=Methanosalsum zhilinae (strain DSM 4017 / NBRC 107636 / OCM 62 / WeN5) TaxID=679901 RepID=F7XPP9_METZD|nr:phenylalanine--tRNA ligase subunit beta [Methanosalsum zhilinae]AEH60319.1 phenylalanyl-tRNA synthetase, beta subunit [Methanosalsum zhilinae DSM 4017]